MVLENNPSESQVKKISEAQVNNISEAQRVNHFQPLSGRPTETLLAGVDLYVFEGGKRKGLVSAQAQEYGVPGGVESVEYITPETVGVKDEIISIEKECKLRQGQPNQWPIKPRVISCTLSHLKALKAACVKENKQEIALVLEDDANFEPLKWWPAPLLEMVSKLPSNWTVIAAAVSNFNDPEAFRKQIIFAVMQDNIILAQ